MIQSIHIVNFKSIAAATLELGSFNCLVGLNGAGKGRYLPSIAQVETELLESDGSSDEYETP